MKYFLKTLKFISILFSVLFFIFVLIIYPILYISRNIKLFLSKKNIAKSADLNSPKSECKRLYSEKLKFEADIKSAELIDKELSLAKNSKERFLLHQKCGIKFGYEKPNQVIYDRKNKISSIERTICKLEKRIKHEEEISNRIISHLIIDGNNICFDKGTFINTKALIKLLETIPKQLKKTVVFDASIKTRTGKNDKEIESSLSKYAQIYIAPKETEADNYIISLAETEKNSYVISNDNYSDFFDKSPIIEKRIMKFMIIRNSIIVNDLSINATF